MKAAHADLACHANIAGLTALSLPTGWTDGGMPFGAQLVCRSRDERAWLRGRG
jgi:aspartyl-tRNA(Asn)/glutamyl-tRNA(Gln) amidotransferase subunit A